MDVILYEVFVGTMPDGTEVMVQLFRPQGQDKSQACQIAFRQQSWDRWGVPVQLEHRSVTPTQEANK